MAEEPYQYSRKISFLPFHSVLKNGRWNPQSHWKFPPTAYICLIQINFLNGIPQCKCETKGNEYNKKNIINPIVLETKKYTWSLIEPFSKFNRKWSLSAWAHSSFKLVSDLFMSAYTYFLLLLVFDVGILRFFYFCNIHISRRTHISANLFCVP